MPVPFSVDTGVDQTPDRHRLRSQKPFNIPQREAAAVHERQRHGGGLRGVEDDVIAEAGQLVVPAPALEQDRHPADRRQAPGQGEEEEGIDDQLLLVHHPPEHPAPQLLRREVRGLEPLDRGGEGLQQGQAPHVADEDRPPPGATVRTAPSSTRAR